MGHLLTLFAGAQPYLQRVQSTPGLIGYWPLDEASGVVAYDRSGNERNGAHTGVTLGAAGIGDGRTSPTYDGVNDFTNIYSASLAGAFNGAEGTLIVWAKVSGAGVWTDGVPRYLLGLYADAASRVMIYKIDGTILAVYKAGGVENYQSINTSTPDWICVGLTWSKSASVNGEVFGYFNSVQINDPTPLGVWAGEFDGAATVIGAFLVDASNAWSGTLAHVSIYNRALSPAEIAGLSHV